MFSKSFYSVTMKLGLQAYQKYFQACVKNGPQGHIFGPQIGWNKYFLLCVNHDIFLDCFSRKKGLTMSKLRFLEIFSKSFYCVTTKLD